MPRTPRSLLVAAAGCLVAFAALMTIAYDVPAVRHLDASALAQFVSLGWPHAWKFANPIMTLCDPAPYLVIAAVLLAAVARARGLRRAAVIGAMLVAANASGEALKPLLAHHRSLAAWPNIHQVPAASFPSGHTTAAMALAFGLVLAVRREWRVPAALVGGTFALAMSFAVVVLDAHFPSDVIGGHLLATAWALTALAALRYADRRWPEHGSVRRAARHRLAQPQLRVARRYAVLLALAALALVVTRAAHVSAFVHDHRASVVVASAFTASALVLVAAFVAISSRRG